MMVLGCEILGDSLAVGVAMQRPQCMEIAKVGINSTAYLGANGDKFMPANVAVISLGANDSDAAATLHNLRILRAGVSAKQVYWLIPNSSQAVRKAILTVALDYRDLVIDTRPLVGGDTAMHLHPNGLGYRELADLTIPYGCSIQNGTVEAENVKPSEVATK
jgi:hypothetical protein